MKNETARREVESLDYYLQNHTNDYSEESHTAMMMAVKALEQQPNDDCISRAEAIKIIKEHPNIVGNRNIVVQKIDDLPSITPKTKMDYVLFAKEVIGIITSFSTSDEEKIKAIIDKVDKYYDVKCDYESCIGMFS